MQVELHEDAGKLLAVAGGLLGADPVRYAGPLGVLDGLVRAAEPAPTLLSVHCGAAVIGAAVRTVYRPLAVAALPPQAARPVAAVLTDADPELPGAIGPVAEVHAFAGAYTDRTGSSSRTAMRLRLFELAPRSELRPPGGVAGAARLAGLADVELLGRWWGAFADESLGGWKSPHSPAEAVARAMGVGHALHLWELDGRPVALARVGRPLAGVAHLGTVYTPPECRGRGFGSAVTAAAAAWARGSGARSVVLHTDLANPVSNAIYPRLGFRPVHDVLEVAFTA